MKKKSAFAVFTKTETGLDSMIKGNFGNDKEAAEDWAEHNKNDYGYGTYTCDGPQIPKYPNGLFVKEVKY